MTTRHQLAGVLLAAGRGSRFDPTGAKNKLMQLLPDGDAVVGAAAKNLLAVVPVVVAVVRPGTPEVVSTLQALGCEVTECQSAGEGMAASLVHGLSRVADADGWIIALGDMPHVQTATMTALSDALCNGADIVVPTYQGRRGNPVAFGRVHLLRLLQLTDDQGARKLLQEFPVLEIAVADPGIHHDVDSQADLSRRP